MGFGVPLQYWLKGSGGLSQMADRLRANNPKGEFYSPIKKEAIDRLMPKAGGWDQSQGLWTILFLEAWWQRHFV